MIRPILGETLRYFVGSASNPEQQHLVDIMENECGCPDYVCRRRAYQEKTGRPYRCKHLREAREHVLDEIIENLKEQELSR